MSGFCEIKVKLGHCLLGGGKVFNFSDNNADYDEQRGSANGEKGKGVKTEGKSKIR